MVAGLHFDVLSKQIMCTKHNTSVLHFQLLWWLTSNVAAGLHATLLLRQPGQAWKSASPLVWHGHMPHARCMLCSLFLSAFAPDTLKCNRHGVMHSCVNRFGMVPVPQGMQGVCKCSWVRRRHSVTLLMSLYQVCRQLETH